LAAKAARALWRELVVEIVGGLETVENERHE
jgi:hypothetical protein